MAVPTTLSGARSGLRQLPLQWTGALRDPSGYADEARSYLVALERSGYQMSAVEARWTTMDAGIPSSQSDAIARAVTLRPPRDAARVYHIVPGPRLPVSHDGPTITRTMFETDRVPNAWVQRLAESDEIWVPCVFNLGTFEQSGIPRDRLRVLPETIDFELFAPAVRERPNRPFTFLTSFDFTDRKGWDVLLDAWAEAFSPADDVRLVLKCISIHGLSAAAIETRVQDHLRGRKTAPIELNSKLLMTRHLPRLYGDADAFVLASRGEGWGRPYMEAMAMGLPTIGSRWSGNLDFMHDGNSWLIDGDVIDVPANAQAHTPHYIGHRWFDPDPDALIAAMREVAAGGADVVARATGARADLMARFGAEQTAARIVELTESALELWRERSRRTVACAWRGAWGSIHSLAVVNEAVAGRLDDGAAYVQRRAIDGDPVTSDAVGVAQQWPPSFEAPSEGPFVLYQPWEFGEVPAAWVEPIRQRVDEVWAPSEYARQSFLEAGIAPELVHVVPNGVDLERFTPGGPVRPLATEKGTVFLFVGGTTYRKGIDLLLEAYGKAFSADDDVCLVVKGFGSTTLYRGQTADKAIAEFRLRPGAPELHSIDDDLPYAEIPALYRAADVLVQPYRGEGFCLPALEALACGVPVIVTAGGPTDDFAPEACAWPVASTRVPMPAGSLPPDLSPAGGGFLLEPVVDALVAALRDSADPAARSTKAAQARSHAEKYSWEAAAEIAGERLAALQGVSPIRFVEPAAVDERRRLLLVVDADWDVPATWAPAVRAYAAAFGPDADVTLMLPDSTGEAGALVERELADAGIDLATLADVVLANIAGTSLDALALTADAFICPDGRRPARARRVVAADPDSLKTLLLETS